MIVKDILPKTQFSHCFPHFEISCEKKLHLCSRTKHKTR